LFIYLGGGEFISPHNETIRNKSLLRQKRYKLFLVVKKAHFKFESLLREGKIQLTSVNIAPLKKNNSGAT